MAENNQDLGTTVAIIFVSDNFSDAAMKFENVFTMFVFAEHSEI